MDHQDSWDRDELDAVEASLPLPPTAHEVMGTAHNEDETKAVASEGDAASGLRRRHPGVENAEEVTQDTKDSAATQPETQENINLGGVGVDPQPTSTPEEIQCRICLGGVEDEAELGKMFRPCLCTGSMRYCHVSCINRWRGSGSNNKSYLECPQCHHRYRVQSTFAYGLATSSRAQYVATGITYTLITLAAGSFMLKMLLAALDAETERKAAGVPNPHPNGQLHGDVWMSEDGSTQIYYFGAGLIFDILSESLDTSLDLLIAFYRAYLKGTSGQLSAAFEWFLARYVLGLAVVGSLSFLSLLMNLGLFVPVQMIHHFRGQEIFGDSFGGVKRFMAGINSNVVILVCLAMGVFNSVLQCYDMVVAVSMGLLKYVPTQILEVSPEDYLNEAGQPITRPRVSWRRQWWQDRKFRTMRGWYELAKRCQLKLAIWWRLRQDRLRHEREVARGREAARSEVGLVFGY